MIKKKFLLANSGSHWGNWSKLNHAQIGVLNHELKIIDRKFVPMAQCVIVTSEILAQRTYSKHLFKQSLKYQELSGVVSPENLEW